jgi:hypothetical protein
MLQLRAVVLERDARAVLEKWGELGTVELTRTEPGPDAAPLAPRDASAELARCHCLLDRVKALRQALAIAGPLPNLPSDSSNQPENLAEAEARLGDLESRTNILLMERQRVTEQLARSEATCNQLGSYQDLDLPLDGADSFTFLHFVTGSLPAENWEMLQGSVDAQVAWLPLPMNRPTPNPSEEGSQTRCARKPVPLLGGVRGGFKVPMRVHGWRSTLPMNPEV